MTGFFKRIVLIIRFSMTFYQQWSTPYTKIKQSREIEIQIKKAKSFWNKIEISPYTYCLIYY